MRIGPNAFRFIERGLLFSGLLLLITFSLAHVQRFVMSRAEIERFERKQAESAEEQHNRNEIADGQSYVESLPTRNTDYSLWSAQRTKVYQANLGKSSEA